MTFNIAFLADTHLGYRAKVKNTPKGINVRVQDGYDAFKETINQIIKSDVKIDAVVHGGDLFHQSKPSVRDIATAQFYLRELSKRGIPFYGVAGNHDATDIRAELAAVASVNDPDRKIYALFEPYAKYNLADGIVLHSVSHHGLSAESSPEVKPEAGMLNLFTTHGAALDPKNKDLLRCADSPREQIIPVELIADDAFVAKLLGHYHSRYPIGGESLNAWYAGSAIRRGFSDAPGDRGWLLVQVSDNGNITVTPKNISQRSQFDLDSIDATDLSSSDVMEKLLMNIERTTEVEDEPIVRQRIVNASKAVRDGLDRNLIADKTAHMLLWQLEYIKLDSPTVKQAVERLSLSSRGAINIIDGYRKWAEETSKTVPEQYRDAVVNDAEAYLKKAKDASDLEGHKH